MRLKWYITVWGVCNGLLSSASHCATLCLRIINSCYLSHTLSSIIPCLMTLLLSSQDRQPPGLSWQISSSQPLTPPVSPADRHTLITLTPLSTTLCPARSLCWLNPTPAHFLLLFSFSISFSTQPPHLIISFSAAEVFSSIKMSYHNVTGPFKSLQWLKVEPKRDSNLHGLYI